MNESVEVSVPRVDDPKNKSPEQKKSFFQGIWGRFKEGIKKLWGNADAKFELENKKAEEISEKIKTESLKDYFRTQIENFKDGIQERVYDIYGGLYDIGAAVSQAKAAFWHNFMGGKFVTYMAENRQNVKTRKEKAKDYYEKAKLKAKENRDRAKKHREAAKEIKEKAGVAG